MKESKIMADAISLNDFKKNLDAGKYGSLAGGRRGVGKIHGWDEATREQARKLVDKHFGASEASPAAKAPKAAKKAAPKPKKAAKAAAPATATGKRRGRPPGSGKKQQAAQVAKPAAPKVVAPKLKSVSPRTRKATNGGTQDNTIGAMTLVVGTISEAIKAIKMCRELAGKPTDLDPEVIATGRILGSVVRELGNAVVPALAGEGKAEESASRRRGPRKAEAPANGLAAEPPPQEPQDPAAAAVS